MRRMWIIVFFISVAIHSLSYGKVPLRDDRIIIASDYPSVYDAVEAAKKMKIRRVRIPAGRYVITKSINLTNLYGDQGGMTLEGDGWTTQLIGRTGKDPVIDMTGSCHNLIENFSIRSETSDIGILLGRNGRGSGGGSVFRHVSIGGPFRIAAVYSFCAECAKWYHCSIANSWKGSEGGDAYIFTQYNYRNIKSPYLGKMKQSTNTVLEMYGCFVFNWGPNSVGMRIVGGTSDITIYGGYHAFSGFSAFYLDGSRGGVSSVTIDGVRVEAYGGKHVLYAVGRSDNIKICGSIWECEKEAILAEAVPSQKNPAHKSVYLPDKSSNGMAQNWTVREMVLSRRQALAGKPRDLKDFKKTFVAMMFDNLLDSTIERITFRPTVYFKEDPNQRSYPVANALEIMIKEFSRRNTFVVSSRDAVELGTDASQNEIIALHDPSSGNNRFISLYRQGQAKPEACTGWPRSPVSDYRDPGPGIRRRYIMPDKGISFLNLGMVDLRTVKGARKGDLAIHNGAGFSDGKPRLAIFDGKKWIYFDISKDPK